MLNQKQIDRVYSVINDPAHGKEFYNEEMFTDLLYKIDEILKTLEIDETTPEDDVIIEVNNYLKQNVKIRNEYFIAQREVISEFPEDELQYRTAYAALCKGEAMCAGYAEASRVLLECCDFNTHTLLSKLPGKGKVLLHYVTAVEYDIGSGRKYFVFDPERESSCDRKGYDFRQYLLNMTYIKPEEYFYKNKVGKTGLGPNADYYIANFNPARVKGKNEVGKLLDAESQITGEQ